jgi:hypothetical protein
VSTQGPDEATTQAALRFADWLRDVCRAACLDPEAG